MAVIATILLTIHLLAMNVASAGPLVCLWLQVRGRRGDEAAWQAGQTAIAMGRRGAAPGCRGRDGAGSRGVV